MLYAARLFQVALHALVALAAWIENTRRGALADFISDTMGGLLCTCVSCCSLLASTLIKIFSSDALEAVRR